MLSVCLIFHYTPQVWCKWKYLTIRWDIFCKNFYTIHLFVSKKEKQKCYSDNILSWNYENLLGLNVMQEHFQTKLYVDWEDCHFCSA